MSEILDVNRTVPYSTEAERSVLGAVFFDPARITALIGVVSPDDFYIEQNKEVYKAMLEIFNQGIPVDVVVLKEQLIKRGSFDGIGGLSFLADLANAVPTTANLSYYINILLEKSTFRKLIKAGSDIVNISYEAKEELDIVLDISEQKILDILKKHSDRGLVHVSEVLPGVLEQIHQRELNKNKITGVASGFVDLDKITFGFQKSDLILIAARPRMGKTSFALNIAAHAAVHKGSNVAFFSLEMSNEQLVNRLICSEGNVDNSYLRKGLLNENEWSKITDAATLLRKSSLYINDKASITLSEIRSICKRMRNLDLIIIDYLQLMTGTRAESRQQEVSDLSRSLKILAKELEVPVIALSQLSRAPDQRSDHRPVLSDLRESGSIEQDADIVMFIYRDVEYNPDTEEPNVAECLVRKHRNGETGNIKLCWLGQNTKFTNIEQ